MGIGKFKAVKPHVGTWKGRPGMSQDFLMTSNPIGPRVVLHRWTDTDEVTVRAVDGDAWKGRRPFRELLKLEKTAPTTPELDRMLERCAGALAFPTQQGHS